MNPVPGEYSDRSVTTFIVGDLHVDVGQQRVTRAGSDIPLPNLSFRLLVALVRAAPNVLSNDALMTHVWPGLVVSPETVNKRVNLLREALGDDPRKPRYIAGVRSRGYRLIAAGISDHRCGAAAESADADTGGVPRAAELPVPPIPIDAHRTGITDRHGLALRRWAAFSVVATGLLIAATIGIRWAGRHQVEGAIPAPLQRRPPRPLEHCRGRSPYCPSTASAQTLRTPIWRRASRR